MLSSTDLDVLDILTDGRDTTMQQLATKTSHSQSHLYSVIDELTDAGIINEQRGDRNRRLVRAAPHPVMEAYRDLNAKLGHVDWPDLLSPATIRVLWYLDEPRRVVTIADRLDVTRQAVHNVLDSLKHRGVLSPHGPEYGLRSEFQPLLEFVHTVILTNHRQTARQLAPSATVTWCEPRRAVVRTHTREDTAALADDDEWTMTGLAKFADYGLQFFLAGEPAFWYAPEDPRPTHLVCHSLLQERGPRPLSYAMLLIERTDISEQELRDTATWYDLENIIEDMYRFIHCEIDQRSATDLYFPSRTEYQDLKSQYGVQ